MTRDPHNKEEPFLEGERLEKLDSLTLLDTPPEALFDELTELAAHVCDKPVALISVIDEKRQWFKSRYNWNPEFTERSVSFCRYTIMGEDIMEVNDSASNPVFRLNPMVTGDPGIRYYAGMPIFTSDGFPMGTICVLDFVPSQLTEKQKEGLRTISKQVARLTQLKKSSRDQIQKHKLKSHSRLKFLDIQELIMKKLGIVMQDEKGYEDNQELITELIQDLRQVVKIEKQGLPKHFEKYNLKSQLQQWQSAEAKNVQLNFEGEFPELLRFDWDHLKMVLNLVSGLCDNLQAKEKELCVEVAWQLQSVVKIHFEFTFHDHPELSLEDSRHQLRIFLINSILSFFSDELSIDEKGADVSMSFEMQMSSR